ncbi:S8 family peptidase [Xanthomonas phaseoli pv. dieffenbachiae]|uniref:S8 family peptidase n=1 Tax=Xanthomonas citri TaxID=346 RepID=UPI001B1E8B91|nr:S8 family peptidase [Xanthomonas citri]MBO9749741.1 S8 family peptidase [Xanthomonas phaseoli pv. dieffenbachiae]MBO9750960.1 S8 family peptidase [Xanthomonas phaseoli pv. dieffenbachiae]
MDAQLTTLQQDFERYKASVSGSVAGLEPEAVLVIEIAGSVNEFRQAVEAIGLEWMGEWDIDDIPPDEDFFERNTKGERTNKAVKGRMFLSLGNEAGMRELLSLWEKWRDNKMLPSGKTKWRDVFNQTVQIRRWGIEEALRETGMLDCWQDLLNPINPAQAIRFQIELFYRRSEDRRRQSERNVATLLQAAGGKTLGGFIDMPEIAFHAVKAELPAVRIQQLLNDLESESHDTDIQLFKFHGVMYFRPTGQSLAVTEDGEGVDTEIAEGVVDLPPIAAILDGVPNVQHQALKGRLLLDDPDNLSAQYQPGDRKHGTAMASLVVHGEMAGGQADPLPRLVYVLPIMQPDPHSLNRSEHVPDEVFFEDRIARAVRRMFEGEGAVPAQAPTICIINLSIGDPSRPFIHTPSPWARLLDWLSWKYRVLFCVSAGNYPEAINIALSGTDYLALADPEKVEHVLKCIQAQLSGRRILSPAEAINAITVGATHADSAGNYYQGQRTDLLPGASLFSPAARFGHGFRRSVKPEILFPGGRQLYRTPVLDSQTVYQPDGGLAAPGQQVAWDSNQAGALSKTVHTRGTSNATALATRSAARIYEVLDALRGDHEDSIPQGLISVLIKALLVHGAKQDDDACAAITAALKTRDNSRQFKEVMSRYLGYGAVQIERVLACTEQRGTVLSCGEIRENEIHEYRLPLPPGLSSSQEWRRMVVTLAWFSPVNPGHRNFREAKLEMSPANNWGTLPLKLARQDGDHNQVLRGTVQHEVLEGTDQIAAFQDGDSILLHIACKKDATARLDDAIPYGLAVTLEVAEGIQIPIYEQLRTRLQPQVAVSAVGGTP